MRELTVAAPQCTPVATIGRGKPAYDAVVREAAAKGARLVLLQELFESRYFCVTEEPRHLRRTIDAQTGLALIDLVASAE